MTRAARFEYALQPVLLQRQWDLDALKLDLALLNASLTKLREEHVELERESELIAREWKNQSASSSHIVVERLSTVIYYMDHLAQQRNEKSLKIGELELERESLIDRVALAQRSLDAIEQHRDETQERLLKQRLNTEFKLADDHWSTLNANRENHDH